MRPLSSLVAELEAFTPPLADDVDWAPLADLLDELFTHGAAAGAALTPLLRVLDRFERYPAFACFWPIVHGIERLPGYEPVLVASLQTTPTRSGVTLLLRVLADGIDHVGDVAIGPLAASLLDRR